MEKLLLITFVSLHFFTLGCNDDSASGKKTEEITYTPFPYGYGFDIELPSQLNVHPAEIDALKSIGITYVNYYINTFQDKGDLPVKEVNHYMMRVIDKLGVQFSISCTAYDPPSSSIDDALQRYQGTGRFRGVVMDEFDHARFIYPAGYGTNRRLIDCNAINTVEDAHDATLITYSKHKEMMQQWGMQEVVATHVWLVLNDFAERNGYAVCPKICKETYSAVSMAIGLWEAKQYQTGFWNDVDLWWWSTIPGHPAEKVKCNLLFSYWMDADMTYLEGCGYNLAPTGKQGHSFSLLNPETYELTPIGETLKWLVKEYVPKHPRKWSARNVKPPIAIIRYEDSWFGQSESPFGCHDLQADSDMKAWMSIFDLLTFGATEDLYLCHPRLTNRHYFFVPMNGTVVYNELADYSLLKEIPLLFDTEKQISHGDMEAVRQCVNEGAICVFLGNLAKTNGFNEWQSGTQVLPYREGKLIVTDDFKNESVRDIISPFIGKKDEIKYTFGQDEVVFKRVGNNAIDFVINGEMQSCEFFKDCQ